MDTANVKLGRFGHHPDPAVDFCVEVDAIEGMVADLGAGIGDWKIVKLRIAKALQFNVGGVEAAVNAKACLRKLGVEFR